MQPQPAQNIYVPPNGASNSTGRPNQSSAGNIYRQNPSSPAPRNRYVHSGNMYPAVHQGVVLGQFNGQYATRTPQIQQCQYSPQYYTPHMYFPYYVPQPTQQQRTPINPGVGAGLNSAMAVPSAGSVSASAATGNQVQIPLGVGPVAPGAVLGVGNTSTVQPVGIAPLVGLQHQALPTQQQNPSQIKPKARSHALQIIHPVTNRNILDDLDMEKNGSKGSVTEEPSSSTFKAKVESTFDLELSSMLTSSASLIPVVERPDDLKPSSEAVQSMEHPIGITINSFDKNSKDTSQQTPVVSAMIDAPSVEIFLKQNHKKSQINCEMKHDLSEGKTCEHLKELTGVSTTTSVNSTCVQESLTKYYTNQQVPQKKLFKAIQLEKNISSKSPSSSSKTLNHNNSNSKQKDLENCIGVSEEEKNNTYITAVSAKIMQLGAKESLTSPQQNQINLVNSNDQQEEKHNQRDSLSSNVASPNNHTVTIATLLAESKEKINNNIDLLNNNINSSSLNKTIVFSTTKNFEKNENNYKIFQNSKSVFESDRTSNDMAIPNSEVCIKIEKEILHEDNRKVENRSSELATLSTDNGFFLSTHSEKIKNELESQSLSEVIANDKKKIETKCTKVYASNSNPKFESLIDYNEGQWSPSNPGGKKQYNREQLLRLREAKASRQQPDIRNTSIFSQTNLMPAFVSRGNKKVQSMVGSFSGSRGSSSSGESNYQNIYNKQSLMSGRGGADSGLHNRNNAKPIIHLNLSLNQDVKLNEADDAWRPQVLFKVSETQSDPENKASREQKDLERRVRGILNKLTPEKFDPLVDEITKLKIDTMEKMIAVMTLVFEKAIDEPNFSVSYAKLCNRLINEVIAREESGTKNNLAYFRNALLDKTQREYNQNVTKTNAKEEKLKPIRENVYNCKDLIKKVELEALLDEEERKIRRRSGGTVRFIGELFKISILTGKIIQTCIEDLLKEPNNEDMLECLCKLLTTVGQKFEQTNIGKDDKSKYSLENVILRMQNIASKNENSKISSRVRFMLQDVIDLRKKNWQSTRNEAPKTMEQIEKEANNEQFKNHQYHYINSISGNSGSTAKRDDRAGRADAGRTVICSGSHSRGDTTSAKRQQSGIGGGSHSQSGNFNNADIWQVQTGKGNRSLVVDSSKLFGMAPVDLNNKKMGGAALFQWNKVSSSQQLPKLANSFAALSVDSSRTSEGDWDRDRSGLLNKGSYNKGSVERDKCNNERLSSQSGSTHVSRENSSSRNIQGVRSMSGAISSNTQKSFSHTKYQQISSSDLSKMTLPKTTSMLTDVGESQKSSCYESNTMNQLPFNSAASKTDLLSSTPPAVFMIPSDSDLKIFKAVIDEMVENAANSKLVDQTTVSCLKKIKEHQRCALLYYIFVDYLHLAEVRFMCRHHLANIVSYLFKNKNISAEHFRLAYNNFAKLSSDLMVDIPELWLYLFEFTGPLIVKKLITVNDLWNSNIRERIPPHVSAKFLKTFLEYCTREVGPCFTRGMWKSSHMNWTDFIDENEVAAFINTNKFQYVENENSQLEINNRESKEKRNKRVVDHIYQLLLEGCSAADVIDYINGNILDVDKNFIKSLTTTLTGFAIKDCNIYSLDVTRFQTICTPVLLRYIDSKEDLELECLYAIQLFVHSLEHPRGLLAAIFGELHDADVIPQETFIAWRDSNDQSAGKGVAVKALNQFFNQVINGETSDDN